MKKANHELREQAKIAGVKLWQIALELGVSEPTVIRWLRIELEPERKKQILEAIENIAGR